MLERVSARQKWRKESGLIDWLRGEEPLAHLGKACGLSLAVLGKEARVAKGRADILCVDETSGGIVVIETQLGTADYDHVARLLKYASEFAATKALLVAEVFSEKMRQAMSGGLHANTVQLVELRCYKDDDESILMSLEALSQEKVKQKKRTGKKMQGTCLLREPNNSQLMELVSKMLATTKPNSTLDENQKKAAMDFSKITTSVVTFFHDERADENLLDAIVMSGKENADAAIAIVEKCNAETIERIATLNDWTVSSLHVLQIVNKSNFGYGLRKKKLSSVLSGTQSRRSRKVRIAFWEKVAAMVEKNTSTRMRRQRALGTSSHGIVYGLARRNVRLAAIHKVSPRTMDVELRITDANPYVASNRFKQMERHKETVERGLSNTFNVAWVGPRGQKGEQVLRLTWKKALNENGPYESASLPKEFAEAVLQAEKVLLPLAKSMDDFLW